MRLAAWLGLPCPGELRSSVGTACVWPCHEGSRAEGLLQQPQLIAVPQRWLYSPGMYFGNSPMRYTLLLPMSEPVEGDTIMQREGNDGRDSPGFFPSLRNNGSSLPPRFWNLWPGNPVPFRQVCLLIGHVWPRALIPGYAALSLLVDRVTYGAAQARQIQLEQFLRDWEQEKETAKHGSRLVAVDRPTCLPLQDNQVLSLTCARVCPCDYETSAKISLSAALSLTHAMVSTWKSTLLEKWLLFRNTFASCNRSRSQRSASGSCLQH